MSTKITADNGAEIQVGQLGITVDHPEGIASISARLSPWQRRSLADALAQGAAVVVGGGLTAPESQYKRERDAAVARADQLRDERDDAVQSCIAVGRERDEWKARAEQAENARDTVATRAGQLEKALAGSRDAHQRSADAHMEWKERALLAEDRLAEYRPEITRADIEKAIDTGVRGTTDGDLIDPDADLPAGECARLAINAVWALVSGDDPAVYVVRDSEVAAVPLKHDRNGWDVGQTWYPPLSRGEVKDLLAKEKRAMVRTLAIARAIGVEAEQAVDPVEAKARELHEVASPAPYWTWEVLVENAKEPYRRIARHVLGQESDHA